MAQDFTDLIAWQKGMSLVDSVYAATDLFPANERYDLARQLRRAVTSVPSNIAEGFAGFAPRDFRRFLRQAQGSVAETDTQIRIAQRLKYLSGHHVNELLDQVHELRRILIGLIASLPVHGEQVRGTGNWAPGTRPGSLR